jgi:hypothetical protein
MLLVRAGNRSVPLVTRALLAGSADTSLVEVLASIGTDDAREALRTVSQPPKPTVAPPSRQSAIDALKILDEIERNRGPGSP